MSQPPYQPDPQGPQPGQPGYSSPSGYPPPAGTGYPQSGGNAYPQSGANAYPQSGGGAYPQSGGGAYPPPANQGFGAPPSAGEGFGGAPAPRKKRSAWKIVAIVVAAVVVLCVGGIGTFIAFNRDKVKDVVEASKIKVVEPEKLGARAKATDPALNTSLDESVKEMKSQAGVTGTVGAVYGDPKKLDILMVIAASSIGGSAKERYDGMVQGIGGSFAMTGVKDVDAGPLGGIAKCGDGKVSEIPIGICMWADSGSFAMLMLFNKKGADLQKDFVSYRGQIEQKA